MKQNVLTSPAYGDLVRNIQQNRNRYENGRVWLKDSTKFKSLFQESDITIASPLSLKLPEGNQVFDFENAKRVHRKYKLSPAVAADPRLWARLAHVEHWEYMQKRWPVDESKSQAFIRQRYFLAGTDSRAVMRNGIARLWWSAQLTYDEKGGADQYELTEVILSRLDIAQQLLERNLGRIRPLVRGFLQFVVENRELCLDAGDTSRKRIRYLAGCLHQRSGVCVLDALSKPELQRFLSEELNRYENIS